MFNERLMHLTAKDNKTLHFFGYFLLLRLILGAFLLIGFMNISYAQKGLSIEPSFHFGVVTKHTPKLDFAVKSPTYGIDINFKFQTFGKKQWHQLRNFPLFGITAMWLRMGNHKVLGNAFSLTPNINISLFEKKKWSGYYQLGSGVAYMSRIFDVNENPNNNAIGSHVVTTIFMKFHAFRQLNTNWKLHTGVSLNHFSNGGSRLPNFGLNIPALMIGVTYVPQPLRKENFIFRETSKKRIRKFGGEVQTGFGLVQRFAVGGPRYPIYIFGIAGNYYLNQVNRLIIGLDYEQNRAIYHFSLDTFHARTRKDAKKKASRMALVIGDEFLFGSWGINLQFGVYLGKFSFLKLGTTYTKFSTRFYLPNKGLLKHKIFLNVSLKTHLTVAEYISLGVGVKI